MVKDKKEKRIGDRYYGGELSFPFRFEDFNCPTPEKMPMHFFPNVKRLDYNSAIKADVSQLRVSAWSVMPRCWYIDAWFDCEECGEEYCWTAKTQQIWFERNHLWSEAYPKICPTCRKKRKTLAQLREEYSKNIDVAILRITDLKTKKYVLDIINEMAQLDEQPLTKGILAKRDILRLQIEKEGKS